MQCSYAAGGNVNKYSLLGDNLATHIKGLNTCKPFGLAIQLLDIYSKEIIMEVGLDLFPGC